MTKEEIIRMALETRLFDDEMEDYTVRLERFAALVAAAEREACAKLCEEKPKFRTTLGGAKH